MLITSGAAARPRLRIDRRDGRGEVCQILLSERSWVDVVDPKLALPRYLQGVAASVAQAHA